MSTPLYERKLSERPQDRAEFDGLIRALVTACRPGGYYRLPRFGGRRRRREAYEAWENDMLAWIGRAYELGRRLYPPQEEQGIPLFVILGYNDHNPDTGEGGPLVVSSRNVVGASWQRRRQGYTTVPIDTARGRLTAKPPNETITVTCQMKDFTQLRGEFPAIMADMWRVLTTGQVPRHGA
jgi:hypothetical protein